MKQLSETMLLIVSIWSMTAAFKVEDVGLQTVFGLLSGGCAGLLIILLNQSPA